MTWGCEMGVPPFKERPKAEVSEILAAASANSQPPGSEEDKLHPLTLDPGGWIFSESWPCGPFRCRFDVFEMKLRKKHGEYKSTK